MVQLVSHHFLIFKETTTYDYEVLRQRIRELAFLNKGLRISLTDLRDGQNREHDYMYEGGIKEYVAYINKNKTPIHDEIIYVEDMQNDIKIEVSMQYNDGYKKIFTLSVIILIHMKEEHMKKVSV